MAGWLLDESRVPTRGEAEQLTQLASQPSTAFRGPRAALAVRLNDVVIHNNRKWFGGANIRLDAIAVHGPQTKGSAATEHETFYQPATFHFPGVQDGDRLAIAEPGLLVFYGRPHLFLDLSILVSRDTKDTADLGALIAGRLNSSEWKQAAGGLLALAVTAPQVALITAGVAGAAVIANIAAEILRQATGNTIALYRVSFLQNRDRFGLGRHPESDQYRVQDLSFWYEIVPDRASDANNRGNPKGL
jgi:hypothetical protein